MYMIALQVLCRYIFVLLALRYKEKLKYFSVSTNI